MNKSGVRKTSEHWILTFTVKSDNKIKQSYLEVSAVAAGSQMKQHFPLPVCLPASHPASSMEQLANVSFFHFFLSFYLFVVVFCLHVFKSFFLFVKQPPYYSSCGGSYLTQTYTYNPNNHTFTQSISGLPNILEISLGGCYPYFHEDMKSDNFLLVMK